MPLGKKSDSPAKHAWAFARRFRRHSFGWRAQPVAKAVREAVADSVEVAEAAERLTRKGRALSIEELGREGVSEEALGRTIVIEFGLSSSAFDVIAPEGYLLDGTWIETRDFGPRFL